MNKISFVVPIYNTDLKLLDRAIQSILKQTYKNIEIIIVNDCSTKDDTLPYLEELETLNSNVIVINNKKNSGIGYSRNVGIIAASGDYIAFCDHDDYFDLTFAEKMLDKADGKDVVVCGYKTVGDSEELLCEYPNNGEYNNIFETCDLVWLKLYRKDFLIKNDIFFPIGCYAEDAAFSIKTKKYIQNIGIVKENLYYHYKNQKSTSFSKEFYSQNISQMCFDYLYNIVSDENASSKIVFGCIGVLYTYCIKLCSYSGKYNRKEVIKRTYQFFVDIKTKYKVKKFKVAENINKIDLLLFIFFSKTNRLFFYCYCLVLQKMYKILTKIVYKIDK